MIIFIQVLTCKFAKYVNISLKKWLQTSKYTAKANESMVKISLFFFTENLIHVDRPTRLYHLEDVIAKEFSHFDGYCYVPNAEKHSEYPEDEAIRQMYRSRAEERAEELREALKMSSAGWLQASALQQDTISNDSESTEVSSCICQRMAERLILGIKRIVDFFARLRHRNN